MYRNGHYGVALLVYAPIGAAALGLGHPEIALLGGAVAVGGAMIPDLDLRVPLVSHRGITHTVWFALLAGVALGGVGALAGLQRGEFAAVGLGGFGAFVGTLTIGAHILADALTPMGIRPFWPVSNAEYSLSLTRADNTLANYALLAVGVVATALAVVAGNALADLLG